MIAVERPSITRSVVDLRRCRVSAAPRLRAGNAERDAPRVLASQPSCSCLPQLPLANDVACGVVRSSRSPAHRPELTLVRLTTQAAVNTARRNAPRHATAREPRCVDTWPDCSWGTGVQRRDGRLRGIAAGRTLPPATSCLGRSQRQLGKVRPSRRQRASSALLRVERAVRIHLGFEAREKHRACPSRGGAGVVRRMQTVGTDPTAQRHLLRIHAS